MFKENLKTAKNHRMTKNDLQSTSQCNAMNNYQYMLIISTEERLYYSIIISIFKFVGHKTKELES
jgi:hypothetical protein